MRFPSHTPDTAVGKAADLLGDIFEGHDSAGTMVRTMAGSASVLAAVPTASPCKRRAFRSTRRRRQRTSHRRSCSRCRLTSTRTSPN